MSELLETNRPRKTEGAGKAGYLLIPMVRVQQKTHAAEPQDQPDPGLPCAMVLRLIRDLPGDHAWLPPSSARRASVFANLAPASERQDHATSPSAPTPLVAQTLRPAMCVHRIPLPTSVTIASRPSSWVRDGRKHRCDLPDEAMREACDRLARRAIGACEACGAHHAPARHSGAHDARTRNPLAPTPRRDGFRARRCASPRNDGAFGKTRALTASTRRQRPPYSAAATRGRPTKPAGSPKRSTITAGRSLALFVTQAPERTV
jgi:hypothetical protein